MSYVILSYTCIWKHRFNWWIEQITESVFPDTQYLGLKFTVILATSHASVAINFYLDKDSDQMLFHQWRLTKIHGFYHQIRHQKYWNHHQLYVLRDFLFPRSQACRCDCALCRCPDSRTMGKLLQSHHYGVAITRCCSLRTVVINRDDLIDVIKGSKAI